MSKNTATIHTLHPAPTPDEYQPTTQELMRFLIVMRRACRRTVAALDQHHDTARQYRRQAAIIKQRANPFDAARIAALDTLADAATDAAKPLHDSLHELGKLLADAAPMIDAGTTLAQRCEILNVNTADRANLTDEDGLHRIVFAHGLEDSVDRLKDDWKNGPMFQASQRVFMDFLLNTQEGRKLGDSLFEPGGMFEDVPMYKQAPDGTMKRQPPRLRVVSDARTEATGNAGL